jgi:hypothetical protein
VIEDKLLGFTVMKNLRLEGLIKNLPTVEGIGILKTDGVEICAVAHAAKRTADPFADVDSRAVAVFTGRKERVVPIALGSVAIGHGLPL